MLVLKTLFPLGVLVENPPGVAVVALCGTRRPDRTENLLAAAPGFRPRRSLRDQAAERF